MTKLNSSRVVLTAISTVLLSSCNFSESNIEKSGDAAETEQTDDTGSSCTFADFEERTNPLAQSGEEELTNPADRNETEPVLDSPIGIEPARGWQLDGTANVTLVVADTLFVGGSFSSIYNEEGGALPRNNLAALNRTTGEPVSFAPELDGDVWALALSPDEQILYVAGSFLTAQGQPRERIAAYDIASGELTDFTTPSPNRSLRAIAVDESKIYVGGLFSEVGDDPRSHVAAFDSQTGALDDSFTASANSRVTSLLAGTDRLWVGGDFNRFNDSCQRGIAAVDPVDGSLQSIDDLEFPVIALAMSDEQVFIAGGGTGGRASAFSRATGLMQWELSSAGNFQAVDVFQEGRYVYFGGHYETVEGDDSVDRLSRHDRATGQLDLSWLPRLNGITSVGAISVTSDSLHIGGDFTLVDAEPREGVATFLGQTF